MKFAACLSVMVSATLPAFVRWGRGDPVITASNIPGDVGVEFAELRKALKSIASQLWQPVRTRH